MQEPKLEPIVPDETYGPEHPIPCMTCVHYRGDLKCEAFPKKIPDEILVEGNDHTSPVEGDHGIMYQAMEKGL